MSEDNEQPVQGTKEYFMDVLGFDEEASESLAKSWERKPPQTEDEIRAGILDERENRSDASDRSPWLQKLISEKKDSAGNKK